VQWHSFYSSFKGTSIIKVLEDMHECWAHSSGMKLSLVNTSLMPIYGHKAFFHLARFKWRYAWVPNGIILRLSRLSRNYSIQIRYTKQSKGAIRKLEQNKINGHTYGNSQILVASHLTRGPSINNYLSGLLPRHLVKNKQQKTHVMMRQDMCSKWRHHSWFNS
jgi:hypothetical protein